MHYPLVQRIALATALCAVAGAASAHHSSAMFDSATERTLTGTVSDFGWTNPHGYLQLVVTAKSGKQQNWTVEFQSLQGMSRQGLRPTSFKAGDKVTVKIHPLRNGTTGGDFISGVLANGIAVGGAPAGAPG